MTARIAAAVLLTLAACGTHSDPPFEHTRNLESPTRNPSPADPTAGHDQALAVAQAEHDRAVLERLRLEQRASRQTTTTRPRPRWGAPDTMGEAFWKALSNCESPTGQVGAHVGYFQFSWDTAAKVGIDGSESYEVQRDAAIEWARRIHPNEGTSSGWPNCWWRALAAVGR